MFVLALIVGVFHGAFGEASGPEASLPDLNTTLVPSQVALPAVASRRGGLSAILACNLHARSLHVPCGVFGASEEVATAGTAVSALLLDRLSSSARCYGQDACCGEGGGHDGGVEGTGVVVDELRRRGRIIICLGGAWRRVGTATMKFYLRCVCAAGVIMCGIPLATAIVRDQARTHDGVIHAGG